MWFSEMLEVVCSCFSILVVIWFNGNILLVVFVVMVLCGMLKMM